MATDCYYRRVLPNCYPFVEVRCYLSLRFVVRHRPWNFGIGVIELEELALVHPEDCVTIYSNRGCLACFESSYH